MPPELRVGQPPRIPTTPAPNSYRPPDTLPSKPLSRGTTEARADSFQGLPPMPGRAQNPASRYNPAIGASNASKDPHAPPTARGSATNKLREMQEGDKLMKLAVESASPPLSLGPHSDLPTKVSHPQETPTTSHPEPTLESGTAAKLSEAEAPNEVAPLNEVEAAHPVTASKPIDPVKLKENLVEQDIALRKKEIDLIVKMSGMSRNQIQDPHEFPIDSPEYWKADLEFSMLLNEAKANAANLPDGDGKKLFEEIQSLDEQYWTQFHLLEEADPHAYESSKTFLTAYDCLQSLMLNDMLTNKNILSDQLAETHKPRIGYEPELIPNMVSAIQTLLGKRGDPSQLTPILTSTTEKWKAANEPTADGSMPVLAEHIKNHTELRQTFLTISNQFGLKHSGEVEQPAEHPNTQEATTPNSSSSVPHVHPAEVPVPPPAPSSEPPAKPTATSSTNPTQARPPIP